MRGGIVSTYVVRCIHCTQCYSVAWFRNVGWEASRIAVVGVFVFFFFFQAEDGIRDDLVTGVQTCALPICRTASVPAVSAGRSKSLRNHTTPSKSGSVDCPHAPGTGMVVQPAASKSGS